MARKTNKTDHLLNLLAGSGSQEDTQREAAEAAEEKSVSNEIENKEAEIQKQDSAKSHPEPAEGPASGGQEAPSVYEAAAGKNVHVVRAIGSEDPIAELIKEELETDLNEAMEKAGVKEEATADAAVQNGTIPSNPEGVVAEAVNTNDTSASEERVEETSVAEEAAAFAGEEGVTETTVEENIIACEPEAAAEEGNVTSEPEMPAQETAIEAAAEKESESEFTEEQLLEEVRGGTIEEQQRDALPEESGDDEMQGYVFHNMMETIVREKVPEYIRQFGVCSCRHCKADVIALSLSKLPPKYVVVHESAISPLRSFYEDHYAGQITVEITKACIAVSSHPHHNR